MTLKRIEIFTNFMLGIIPLKSIVYIKSSARKNKQLNYHTDVGIPTFPTLMYVPHEIKMPNKIGLMLVYQLVSGLINHVTSINMHDIVQSASYCLQNLVKIQRSVWLRIII